MSIRDLPRLHFGGVAVTRLPTGPRSGHYDVAAARTLLDGAHCPPDLAPAEYHRRLRAAGTTFDADGTPDPDGPFASTTGWNLAGNGHFWIDARVRGVERNPGRVETDAAADPVLGRAVDLWGHHNDYLSTTANRARVLDVDPSTEGTVTVLVGRLALGRDGRSHDEGYMLSGEVTDRCAPRRRDAHHVLGDDGLPFRAFRRQSLVYQFVVDAGPDLHWFDTLEASPAVTALRDVVGSGEADGLLVQLAIADMAPPRQPDTPDRWRLRGTVAPWRAGELRTAPGGRRLTARRAAPGPGTGDAAPGPVHELSLDVAADHVVVNAVTAFRSATGAWPANAAEPGPPATVDAGDLTVRRADGAALAVLRAADYAGPGAERCAGVHCVARVDGRDDEPDGPLRLEDQRGRTLLGEEETWFVVEPGTLVLDHPAHHEADDRDAVVEVRSLVRGRSAAVRGAVARQYHHPAAFPTEPDASGADVVAGAVRVVDLGDAAGATVTFDTDERGCAALRVAGVRAGAGRVLVGTAQDVPGPCRAHGPGSARRVLEDEGYWAGAATLALRVLPDHSHLDAIAEQDITADDLVHGIYGTFEQLYSFMGAEVMSLVDEAKFRTHARMIWLMCDPERKDRTYYMPSTREMTRPQAELLRRYMAAVEGARPRATPAVSGPAPASPEPARPLVATRDELDRALRQAATIELAIMLQYLYALWSLPTHAAGTTLVAQGRWSADQLRLVCGDGPGTLTGGLRGTLLEVAREEMIHFLLVNNIILATGGSFHLPMLDFGTLNSSIDVPLDFCLEGLSLSSVTRFCELERPHDPGRATPGVAPGTDPWGRARFGSISELYAAIRDALVRMPDALLAERGSPGGEHHLFMRRSTDVHHPDYQLEVDDLSSALFALDFVTEQGEGHVLEPAEGIDERSHYETFLAIAETLAEQTTEGPGGRRVRWEPAYPVLRNPTLSSPDGNRSLVRDPDARTATELFNRSFALTMRLMAQHFGSRPRASLRRSKLMNAALDLMTGVLRPVAELVVTLPAGHGGRHAGPSFEVDAPVTAIPRTDVALRWFARECRELAETAAATAGLDPAVAAILASFTAQFDAATPDDV